MGIDYFIKELTENDLQADLYGFLDSLNNLSPTGEIEIGRAKQVFDTIRSENTHPYIAITGEGDIIGAVFLSVRQTFIHDCGKLGLVNEVVVREGYGGNGVGSSLTRKAIDSATNFGCYRILLCCSNENVPFYEKLGFERSGNEMRMNLNQD